MLRAAKGPSGRSMFVRDLAHAQRYVVAASPGHVKSVNDYPSAHMKSTQLACPLQEGQRSFSCRYREDLDTINSCQHRYRSPTNNKGGYSRESLLCLRVHRARHFVLLCGTHDKRSPLDTTGTKSALLSSLGHSTTIYARLFVCTHKLTAHN